MGQNAKFRSSDSFGLGSILKGARTVLFAVFAASIVVVNALLMYRVLSSFISFTQDGLTLISLFGLSLGTFSLPLLETSFLMSVSQLTFFVLWRNTPSSDPLRRWVALVFFVSSVCVEGVDLYYYVSLTMGVLGTLAPCCQAAVVGPWGGRLYKRIKGKSKVILVNEYDDFGSAGDGQNCPPIQHSHNWQIDQERASKRLVLRAINEDMEKVEAERAAAERAMREKAYAEESARESVAKIEERVRCEAGAMVKAKTESTNDASDRINPTYEVPARRIDMVHFSVSSPPAVKPGDNFIVDVWAHLESQRSEVERRVELANPEPGALRVIRPKGPFKIQRGTRLIVRLRFEDFGVEPLEDVIEWDSEIGNASFYIEVPLETAPGVKNGSVTIHWEGGLQIARVPIQVLVAAKVVDTAPMTHPVHHIHKAFASYASADRDEVLGRIQGMQKVAPDLKVFLDVVELRSGEDWERRLWQVIPESDVLYLFWSAAAKASPWVEKEWRCGLSTRGEEFIDPVPLVSPEEVRPPQELSKKHFNDWVLAYRRGRPNAG